uniref:Uncharacterized protein n=1 Tax=Eutreptiella gymnastica TaxID=73025 RepID=A0A7S1N1P0_9EUGL|mmetsp:Transcript_106295/g.183281  ORF Transcript_106295/g.183281 Transcript_106295/m.183281 type:complete len:235 (+) Transcript_106295:224-928(+)
MLGSHELSSEPLKLCTFNGNGIFTKVYKDTAGSESHTHRQTYISKFFIKQHISVMGSQGPHVKHLSHLNPFTGFLSSRDILSVCNISPTGNGGTAILFTNKFEVKNAWSLSPRIMFVSLLHGEGFLHNFLIAHFHHDSSLWLAQWRLLQVLNHRIPDDTILLADHNSVIVPPRDAAIGYVLMEHPKVLEARAKEVEVLASKALVDPYVDTHAGRLNCQELAGWTWGFPADPNRQ